ncbi:hypothetical protein GQR58_026025 [Nymphon striatum]|nr:hypothetical protein GQR58_026025 [Nymphon striatum]
MFQDRGGNLKRQFVVDINGFTNEQGQLVLEEDFVWSDGEKSRRVWTISKESKNHYIGKAGDVIGKAKGYSSGQCPSIGMDKFKLATSKILSRQHNAEYLEKIKAPLETLQQAYRPVKKGDSYSLCYNARNQLMRLDLNDTKLVEIKSAELAKAYLGICEDFEERNLHSWHVVGNDSVKLDSRIRAKITSQDFRNTFNVNENQFRLLLIGYDQGEKLRQKEVNIDYVFSEIDQMPMRIQEMQK